MSNVTKTYIKRHEKYIKRHVLYIKRHCLACLLVKTYIKRHGIYIKRHDWRFSSVDLLSYPQSIDNFGCNLHDFVTFDICSCFRRISNVTFVYLLYIKRHDWRFLSVSFTKFFIITAVICMISWRLTYETWRLIYDCFQSV